MAEPEHVLHGLAVGLFDLKEWDMNTGDQMQPRASRRPHTLEGEISARPGDVSASRLESTHRPAEMVRIEHDTRDQIVRTLVFVLPPVALVVGGWLAWGGSLHWQDLLVLAVTYTLTGLGITVGYHRLFTHRSFKTTRSVRALLAVLGSMAVEGPVLEWVATHRKHHRFSDHAGDPHSPHVDHAPGWRGSLHGLWHAHMGWMFRGKDMPNPARYAKDL